MAQGGKAVGVVTAAAIAGGGGALIKGVEHAAVYSVATRGAEYGATYGTLHGAERELPGVLRGTTTPMDRLNNNFDHMPMHDVALHSGQTRPVIIPPGAVGNLFKNKGDQRAIADAFTRRAQPQIIENLEGYQSSFTYQQAYHVVDLGLQEAVRSVAAEHKSALKFEVLSGKLTVDAPLSVGKIDITLGEINVYKVSGIAATAIMACRGLHSDPFKNCVSEALSKTGRALVEQKSEGEPSEKVSE